MKTNDGICGLKEIFPSFQCFYMPPEWGLKIAIGITIISLLIWFIWIGWIFQKESEKTSQKQQGKSE